MQENVLIEIGTLAFISLSGFTRLPVPTFLRELLLFPLKFDAGGGVDDGVSVPVSGLLFFADPPPDFLDLTLFFVPDAFDDP